MAQADLSCRVHGLKQPVLVLDQDLRWRVLRAHVVVVQSTYEMPRPRAEEMLLSVRGRYESMAA